MPTIDNDLVYFVATPDNQIHIVYKTLHNEEGVCGLAEIYSDCIYFVGRLDIVVC